MFFRRLLPLFCALSAACVTSVPEDGRPCPCSPGWTCCAGQCAQVAVCPEKVSASSGGSGSSTGAGGGSSGSAGASSAASGGGSSGTSSGAAGAALSGPAAFPVDYVWTEVSDETAAATEAGGTATVLGVLSSANLSSWAAGVEAEATACSGGEASWDVSARVVSLYLSEDVPIVTGATYTDGAIYLDQLFPDGGAETIAGAYQGASGPIGSSSITLSVLSDLEVAGTFSAEMVLEADGGMTTIAGTFDSNPFVAPVCQPKTTDAGCGDVTCPAGCNLSADCAECIPESSTAGSGTSCVTNIDCCTGICVSGVCTTAGSGSSSSGGTTTTGSSGGGSSSSGGTGSVPVGGSCTMDSECSSDFCAVGDVCTCNEANPSTPWPCKVQSDCCAGAICVSGFCVAAAADCQPWTGNPNPSYDAACNADGGTTEVCDSAGVCIPNCTATYNCTSGETCDANGHCIASGSCQTSCDCVSNGSGPACESGQCSPAPASCASANDCPCGDYCSAGSCVPECTSNAGCQNPAPVCYLPQGQCGPCTSSSQCPTGETCTAGSCG